MNDFVFTVMEGAQPDDALTLVVVAPKTDEATAKAAAAVTPQAVMEAMLAG